MTAAAEAATCGVDNSPVPPAAAAAAAAVLVAESAVTGVAAADQEMGLLLMLKRPGWRKEGTTQKLQHGHTNMHLPHSYEHHHGPSEVAHAEHVDVNRC
jgi:hypothetical protein